jgi:hypothetical protein
MPRRDINNIRTQPSVDLSSLTARRVSVDSVEDTIRKDMESAGRAQLSLQGTLPAEIKEAVSATAKTAAATAVELSVARAAEEATRDVGRANITTRFDDKIKVAAASLGHISQSSDVDEVLRKRSELLAKKRDSLVTAGFTNEEAMQILLADVGARAH